MKAVPRECEELRKRIDDDPESLLRSIWKPAEPVAAHLESCPDCARVVADWRRIVAEIEQLPASVEPDTDLWPLVERRLKTRGRRQGTSAWRGTSAWQGTSAWRGTSAWQGALAVAASLLLVAVLWSVFGRDPDAAVPGGAGDGVMQAADLARFEDQVLVTRRDLAGTVAWSETRLPPSLLHGIASDISTLDRAIGEIRLALRDQPESRRLTLLLADKYRQEAALVKRLSRL